MSAHSPFGYLSIETFLSEYWQKKPLLVKNAFPHFCDPVSEHELAGLSMEEESAARLVIGTGSDWKVRHGPFNENDFNNLPEKNWTLLIQHLDSLNLEVNALLSHFRFIPNWRLDDIMASYAVEGGSVGPHFDYYDVFLLQGKGKKHWKIGQQCDEQTSLQPNNNMKLLSNFECQYDWQVESGDLIYIPAKMAHWGQTIDEAITYSIGFRAPSDLELLLDSTQHLSTELKEDQRFQDGDEIHPLNEPGLIHPIAIATLQEKLISLVKQPDKLACWLGEYSTQLKPGVQSDLLDLDYVQSDSLDLADSLQLAPTCRAAYIDTKDQVSCFINGLSYPISQTLAQTLCRYKAFNIKDLSDEDRAQIKIMLDTHLLIYAVNS